jgi:hypothetical protein
MSEESYHKFFKLTVIVSSSSHPRAFQLLRLPRYCCVKLSVSMASHDHIIVRQTYFHGPCKKWVWERTEKTFCFYGVRENIFEERKEEVLPFYMNLSSIHPIYCLLVWTQKLWELIRVTCSLGVCITLKIYAHDLSKKWESFITKPFKDSRLQIFIREHILEKKEGDMINCRLPQFPSIFIWENCKKRKRR